MLSSLFSTIGFVVKIYSYLCIAYIFLSWLSPMSRSGFFDEVCGPYLNWFRRFRFTQIGMLDFSPILALGFLQILSQFFYRLSATNVFSPLSFLISIIAIIWSFFSFVLNFFVIILAVRLILDFLPEYRHGNFTQMLDRFLSPVFVKIHRLLGGRFISIREQIIISLAVCIAARFLLGALVGSALIGFRGFEIL